jgi:hypothetical protein
MNPRIYNSKAAKQAEYREAKKLGMTCAEYRAHIAAGGKPAPPTEGNKGWYGRGEHAGSRYNEKPTVTPPVPQTQFVPPPPRRKTHIASPKPDNMKYVTACGKFLEDVKVVTDFNLVTCGKCRTNSKITPPEPDTHIFTENCVMTPLCLMRAGKRAKRGERYIRTKGCPPTCKACLAAIAASVITEEPCICGDEEDDSNWNPAALLADEKLDAEIRAKRAADPNWNNREWITTAIDIFQGKIPRPKAKVTPPVPQAQETSVTPPEPVTKPIAVTPKDHSRVPAVEEL